MSYDESKTLYPEENNTVKYGNVYYYKGDVVLVPKIIFAEDLAKLSKKVVDFRLQNGYSATQTVPQYLVSSKGEGYVAIFEMLVDIEEAIKGEK